jgi:hypothetical protein
MPDFEQHGWQGFWIPGRRVNGRYGIAVIVKRRFEVDMMDATCKPVATAPVALMAEDFDDAEPPSVSVRHPGEIAIEKPFVDIMVRGTAHAPGGKPVPEFHVEMKIANVLQRRLRIIGDRHLIWYPPVKWLTREDLAKGEQWIWPDPDFSEPAPIEKLPLRYEHAYGGWAKIILTDDEKEMAAEAQEVGAVVEARRERKKEIEKELAEAEKKKDQPAEKKKDKPGVKDAKAAAMAEAAFGDGGADLVLDEETERRLAEAEAADDGMVIVSEFKHKQEGQGDAAPAEAAEDEEADEDGDGEEEEEEDEGPFTSSKTSMLDLNDLKSNDELRELLSDRAKKESRELEDDEGTLKSRATEHGDIQLHDGNWAAAYIRKNPPKQKKKVDLEQPIMPYPANMAGKGFCVNHQEDAVENLPLPNIEDPDDPLRPDEMVVDLTQFDLKKLRTPAGWAPYPMAWYPRAGHFGSYFWDVDKAKEIMEKVKDDYDPDDPDDKVILEQLDKIDIPLMDPRAFQDAHPKLQVKELRGDEEVFLTNLTPEGNLYFRLPGIHPTATIDMSLGPEPLRFRLDTLLIDVEDPSKPAVELLWRAWYPLRSFDDLEVKIFKKVNIIEVDQSEWIEVKKKEEAAAKKKGDDGVDLLMPEDDGGDDLYGEAADAAYKAQFKRQRGGDGVRLDDDGDAAVFDQEEGRRLSTDVWDDRIREEKDAFIEEQKRLEELRAKARAKAYKARARELADEEFGIIRDPETGEVLAVEPPAPKPTKKKKK